MGLAPSTLPPSREEDCCVVPSTLPKFWVQHLNASHQTTLVAPPIAPFQFTQMTKNHHRPTETIVMPPLANPCVIAHASPSAWTHEHTHTTILYKTVLNMYLGLSPLGVQHNPLHYILYLVSLIIWSYTILYQFTIDV